MKFKAIITDPACMRDFNSKALGTFQLSAWFGLTVGFTLKFFRSHWHICKTDKRRRNEYQSGWFDHSKWRRCGAWHPKDLDYDWTCWLLFSVCDGRRGWRTQWDLFVVKSKWAFCFSLYKTWNILRFSYDLLFLPLGKLAGALGTLKGTVNSVRIKLTKKQFPCLTVEIQVVCWNKNNFLSTLFSIYTFK